MAEAVWSRVISTTPGFFAAEADCNCFSASITTPQKNAVEKVYEVIERPKTGPAGTIRELGCVEFCPSVLGTREAADLPGSAAKLAERSVANSRSRV